MMLGIANDMKDAVRSFLNFWFYDEVRGSTPCGSTINMNNVGVFV
tara:strand:+ start:560 stop:694 length:135 start_codon:yes stop_codon:yes gene_type:complete